MWGRVGDVITDAKFYGNRLRGFGVTGPPPQTPFPIPVLNVHRPYSSVSTTVPHCDAQCPIDVTHTEKKTAMKRFASYRL